MSKLPLLPALLLAALAPLTRAADPPKRPNILMIAVDDLRPELACYGQSQVHSPNIDALARSGTLFTRAYCQQAVCAPSRASFLTGCRPDTTRVTDLNTPLPTVRPDLVTLPQHFKSQGYQTVSLGKIYHHGANDDPTGWSTPPWQARHTTYATGEMQDEAKRLAGPRIRRPPPFESADLPDEAYGDGQVADRAVSELSRLKSSGKPFFLAVGFIRPHLPFAAPKPDWDRYDRSEMSLASNPEPPLDMPEIAASPWRELRNYRTMPAEGPVTDDQARQLIHGYYACVTFMDRQIGKILSELDRLGLRDSTVVVLWGDHGWHLGDHGLWCKHTNFESAVRAPLILAGPGVPAGARSDALAEFVDVYPTLCDLADLPAPDSLEGLSLTPVMRDPSAPWKRAAFSQYPHAGRMGRSVTDGRFRFTKWPAGRGAPDEYELYDHATDPAENQNVADKKEYAGHRARLEKLLAGGWKAARP